MKKLIALVSMIAAAIIVPAVLLAWGPGGDARPTYTWNKPADHVTFNSITDNPKHGDERNFVQVRDAEASDATYTENIDLVPGHEYVIFVYYHNDASSSLSTSVSTAYGSYVRAEIPGVVAKGASNVEANGYVGASNAKPSYVWDEISFNNKTNGDIALSYVPKSAVITNNGDANGEILSDNIVTTGAEIGYDTLDGGVIPGCDQYSGYVTFRVKADQPNFTVSKQIRKSTTATGGWIESVTVDPKDSVDYLITYQNTGTLDQNDIVISDQLPAGVSYVEGSTRVANNTNPTGIPVGDNITKGGINIGNYAPNDMAYIKFTARVASNDELANCGVNNIRNNAIVYTDNGSKADTADLTVNKTCAETPPVTPKELPVTGAGANIAAFLGLGALVASIGYYLASRRVSLKK